MEKWCRQKDSRYILWGDAVFQLDAEKQNDEEDIVRHPDIAILSSALVPCIQVGPGFVSPRYSVKENPLNLWLTYPDELEHSYQLSTDSESVCLLKIVVEKEKENFRKVSCTDISEPREGRLQSMYCQRINSRTAQNSKGKP